MWSQLASLEQEWIGVISSLLFSTAARKSLLQYFKSKNACQENPFNHKASAPTDLRDVGEYRRISVYCVRVT